MLISCDFKPFLCAQICAVSTTPVVATMDLGGCCFHRIDEAATRIHPHVAPYDEISLPSFLIQCVSGSRFFPASLVELDALINIILNTAVPRAPSNG